MPLPERIKENILQTVGYNEAGNKASFRMGMDISVLRCEEYYESEIGTLKTALEHAKMMWDKYDNQLSIIAKIIYDHQSH